MRSDIEAWGKPERDVPITQITKTMFVVGFWQMNMRVDGDVIGDVMCTLYREPQIHDGFVIDYRFRYYAENDTGDPFDGRDRKNFHRALTPPGCTEQQAIDSFDGLVGVLQAVNGDPENGGIDYCDLRRSIIRGDGDAFLSHLSGATSVHYMRERPRSLL